MNTKHHIKERTLVLKLGKLKEDFSIYPRGNPDDGHVHHIVDAMNAGVILPDIIAEDKTWRIVDGWHRERGLYKIHGEKKAKNLDIRIIARTYASEIQLFLDVNSLNSAHGRALTTYDRRRAVLIAEQLGIDPALMATVLNTTVERIHSLKTTCATVENTRVVTPLKMPIRHMAGQQLTQEQADIIPKLGGNQQMFYVDQLLMLIDSKMLNTANEPLMEKLQLLYEKLDGIFPIAHA